MVQLKDLIPTHKLGESYILLVRDSDIEQISMGNPVAIIFDFVNRNFSTAGIGNFLKFAPFEEIDPDDRYYYRLMIQQKISDEVILEALMTFGDDEKS